MKTHISNTNKLIFGVAVCLAFGWIFCTPNLTQAKQEHQTGNANNQLRESIQRAIAPIETAMVGYRENRRCFSCHHHAHAIIGLSEIARRGLDVDRELLQFQFVRTLGRTKSVEQRYRKHQNIGGGVDTAAHALMTMRVAGYQPDLTTEAMVAWILKRDRDRGYWTGTKNRAPTQTSDITRTWLCLDAMEHFGTPGLLDDIAQRKAKSRQWLLSVDALSTEDKVSRIRALSVIGDAPDEVERFSEELVKEQNDDGGWAQTGVMKSDAYATGTVLMTLHQYAGLATSRNFYRRGVEFLSSTQQDDGTWHVKTRATRVQEYFESGFPHGRDQYISFTATCWAATAMALTLPESAGEGDHSFNATSLSLPMVELGDADQREFQTRFDKEIWPLISDNGKSSCIRCHNSQHRSSFRLKGESETDFAIMLGQGWFHPRDPGGILFPVTSENRKLMMPPSKLPRLNDEQLETLTRFAKDLYRLQNDENAAGQKKPGSVTKD